MGSVTAGPGWTAARVATLAGAAAYAGSLAVTTPFTLPADVLTATGLAAGAAALACRLAADRRAHHRLANPTGADTGTSAADIGPPGTGVGAGAARAGAAGTHPGAGGSLLPWIGWVALLVAWELYCFFGGPRPAHPTLSSLYDIAARWTAVKAVLVLAWLALGWAMVRR